MQQKKNTTLTTSTANGRAAHTIPTLMKRITVLLALIVSFALGARAADYVFTYTYGDNTYFLGQSTDPTTSFVPNASIYTGNSGSTFRNANGYYIRYYNDELTFSATTGTNLTITNNNIAYVEEEWWGDTYYYLNMNKPNNSNREWRMSDSRYYLATAYTVTTSSVINNFTISGDATIKTVGTYNYTHTNATYYDTYKFNNKTYYSTNASQAATTTEPVNNLPTITNGYTWTIENNSYATVNASTGAITVNSLPTTATEVTLTCSISRNGVTKTATKTITLQQSGNTPTAISASDFSLAVGTDDDISYTLTGTAPIYDKVEATSSNTGIFTVVTSPTSGGKVTLHPVAMGNATLTLIAKAKDGTTNACSTTVKITVAERVKTPMIEYTSNGAKALTTITCTTEGATIYYTIDGSEPNTTSLLYENPFEVDEKVTVKAMAVKTGYINSSVASRTYETSRPTGTDDGVVTLNDLEDHNWTYYQQPSNLPSGYPTTYLSSPNPRNVKITYRGGGINGASPVAISALEGEGQNEMVYYKTLEKSVPGMSGDYPYTVISNPFSKRPKQNSTYYGFAGWKVVDGGEYISEHNDNDVLNLDETIHFTNLDNNYTPNCMSAEVVFEATWTQATVKTGNSAPSFTNGTYETNFWVLTGNPNNAITVPTNCTMTARYPDGSVSWDGNFTRAITAGGNNAKVEFVNMYSTSNVNANGYTFTMGRGIVNSRNGGTLYGVNSNKACTNTVKIESGTYSNLYNFGDDINEDYEVDQLMILGCDYDRAKNDNTKLLIRSNMYVGLSINLNRATNSLYVRTYIKSGNLGSTVVVAGNNGYTGAGGTNTYYFSVSGTHNAGRRFLCVEGGRLDGIAGGMDEINTQSTTARSFDLRVRGTAQIDGVVYGAAEFAGARGTRTMVFTGGLVKGWIAAGANGTRNDGGKLNGTSYVYFGGKARLDSDNSTQRLNSASGGNLFGAGCGFSASAESGEAQLGTNVVVADESYVERGVYGGGGFGYCATTQTSNIFILGGIVDGNEGGITNDGHTGTGQNSSQANPRYLSSIDGGVYGGACQNRGGTVNIIMNGGTVNGSVYGGSNYTGTLSGTSTVTLNGGTINGSLYGGGNGEGSANTNVTGAVQVNVYGGTVTDAVYGCNNNAGAPQSTVKVDIYGTDPAPAEGEYALHAVYGGGNKASYNRTPIVTVHNCDNSIEYVYGGGNAAAVAATDVTIWGGNVIGNVFGGGHGYKDGAGADVKGNVNVAIKGGTIKKVFGGSNSKGNIDGTIELTIDKDGDCPMRIGEVYGGGNEAAGNAGTINIGCTGAIVEGSEGHVANPGEIGKTLEGIGAVYGGANNADIGTAGQPSDITLNINSGMVVNVFGGNNTGGNINGTITVNVNKNEESCGWYVGNVYGAGNLAAYTGSPVVNIQNGTVSGNVFGGGLGKTAIVKGNPQVTIGDAVAEHTAIVGGDVYGGGDAANVVGTPVVNIVNKCNTTIGNVYGGGNAADVNGTDVNIDGGIITGMVFGGGHGDNSAEPQISANVNGNVNLDITGGTINKVFGGSNSMGNITGSIALNIQKVDGHCDMRIAEVYGGGNEADGNAGSLTIGCTGALVEGDEGHLAHPENIGKTLEGIGAVYGGANNANIGNDVTLNINSGMVAKVFGGNNTGGTVNGNVTVNVNKSANTCGWYVGKVHGGGYGKETNVAKDITVNIENGTIYGDVYGGSALGKVNTDTDNTTTVNLKGGIIKGDAYGGGLGDSTTEADVNGNVTVTLNGTAFELTTTTDDKGNSIPTSGRIFGCNNINGSPKGTVLVWVQKTVGPTNEKPAKGSGIYELQAVYGGGNLAAYKPANQMANGQFTSYTWGEKNVAHVNTNKPVQVVIDGCDETSIEYVYGGGNAAATPATDVTILGSYEIGSVFGGGNGKDRYTLDGGTTWNENKGADVGIINAEAYATDKSQGKYGTGNAMTSVLGGTVHNIYGGSNMKGNIVGNAVAYLDAASDCELNAGDIYGGGNEAYMDGGSGIQLGCIKYLKEIYGGARNADVGGDINLTITSGHFDRIFGGNNLGGAIKGSITVNIEETGCNPITIGELYGCGNKAAYTTPEGKQDPTLNIRSFTSIGNVYGGGLGEKAVVTGNPTVNINVVKGVNNAFDNWPYNDGRTIDFGDDYKVTLPVHEKGKIGAIGTVFGGGNAAKVIGNTNVNIGTETSVVFESLKGDERTKTVEGADIRGNVYGGGNKADVTGKTNVKVGRN